MEVKETQPPLIDRAMDEASLILEWASQQQLESMIVASCTALVLYDFLLTFRQEVRLVWAVPFGPAKVLFLLIRYLPSVDLPLLNWYYHVSAKNGLWSCHVMFLINLWVESLGMLLNCIVIGLRTWAVWHRNRLCGVFILLALLFTVGWCMRGIIILTSSLNDTFSFGPSTPDWGCPLTLFPPALVQIKNLFTAIFAYEAFILAMTIIQGLHYLKGKQAQLTTVLYRDAFVGSTILCTISLITAYMAGTGNTYFLGYIFVQRTMTIIIPTRIILNIRDAANPSLARWDMTTEHTTTTQQFSVPAHNDSWSTSPSDSI